MSDKPKYSRVLLDWQNLVPIWSEKFYKPIYKLVRESLFNLFIETSIDSSDFDWLNIFMIEKIIL
jgi:hypothetical protein